MDKDCWCCWRRLSTRMGKRYHTDNWRTSLSEFNDNDRCSSTNFSVHGHVFNKIYGYALGYQKGCTWRFSSYYSSTHNIDQQYLDGLSITLGNPHQHIWSYGAGISKTTYINQACNCPCSSFHNEVVPNFVRDHYYCESGASNNGMVKIVLRKIAVVLNYRCHTSSGHCLFQ